MKIQAKKGFTLIELMIVVAIIGILAAIAIPQFANMVAKSQEGSTKGNLGTIRSALSIYYGDTEGFYPEGVSTNSTGGLQALTLNSKYVRGIPQANIPKTQNNVGHTTMGTVLDVDLSGAIGSTGDVGGWLYDNVNSRSTWGSIAVACTHSDIKQVKWTSF